MSLEFRDVVLDPKEDSPKTTNPPDILGGISVTLIGFAGIYGIFLYGPIDLVRISYHQISGNIPILKQELLEYTRRDLQIRNPKSSALELEKNLANVVHYELKEEKINPLEISFEKLWDASEDHASSLYQRWVWPSLHE